MVETKSRAIVLRAVKYGESQLIVDLLTRERGRVSFICHLPKTSRGKVRKQFFQPLTLLAVCFDYRARANLQRFRDIGLAQPYVSMPFDPHKLSIAMFLAEFLTYTLRGEEADASLYDYVENSLLWLDNADGGFANFHLVFMMRLSRFIGFYPNLTEGERGAWFDLREGAYAPCQPSHPDYLSPQEAAHIRQLMRMDYENMHLFRMNRMERNRCTEIILYYYRLHVADFPEMRSLEVLRSLF